MENLILENLDNKESKWEDVKSYILPLATHVEFNILYSDVNLDDFKKNMNLR